MLPHLLPTLRRHAGRHAWRRAWGDVSRALGLGLTLLLLGGTAAAQSPSTWYSERPGPYLLFAAGGSQYEYDCRSYYYSYDDCAYGRAGAGKVGLGFRFFLNKFLTIRVELRDTIYYENGFPSGSLRNQLMAEFGFSIFLPTVFQER